MGWQVFKTCHPFITHKFSFIIQLLKALQHFFVDYLKTALILW